MGVVEATELIKVVVVVSRHRKLVKVVIAENRGICE